MQILVQKLGASSVAPTCSPHALHIVPVAPRGIAVVADNLDSMLSEPISSVTMSLVLEGTAVVVGNLDSTLGEPSLDFFKWLTLSLMCL